MVFPGLGKAALLLLGGFGCGVVNALAGGGSFLSLPVLLYLGLPPQVANATNRLSILLQVGSGLLTYHASGVRPWRRLIAFLPPAILGVVPGALLAAHLEPSAFRVVSALLLVGMAATVFVKRSGWSRARSEPRALGPKWLVALFLLGFYGGFLQAGVGTLLLGLLVVGAGLGVVEANAVKFGIIGSFTAVALFVFGLAGQVAVVPGLLLAAGSMAGGAVGARLVVSRGTSWVRVVVVLSAVAAALKMLIGF